MPYTTPAEIRRRKTGQEPNERPALVRDEATVVDYEHDFAFLPLFKALFGLIILNFAVSLLVTGTPLWGESTKWTNQRYLAHVSRTIFRPLPEFSDAELALYDGEAIHEAAVANSPYKILIALNGTVFDVSGSPETYGPGGPYHGFAGRDAARAFVTGCFSNPAEYTHDMRGLDPTLAQETVTGWTRFFDTNHKYWRVGTVVHEPLELDEDINPPPEPCSNGRGQKPGFRDEYILRKKKKMVIKNKLFE
ncbi:uncharacterized protein SAPINGB_P004413 [Magnusiomyces paraingens]|uniref:Cytochrome b5 heme-binding domain-containing protein n=1 Tax=Magnusiomyces paraingens TaxID=2606893 RepID=A0A5E8BUC8_9ASCO|nr:uncharacterized protein SAPINGB_P004413 [Saprochaete ingens]VVT55072.1 unnamed protein product [Saprochaete ingens]